MKFIPQGQILDLVNWWIRFEIRNSNFKIPAFPA